jgi:superfamily II DNA/RNA helicase
MIENILAKLNIATLNPMQIDTLESAKKQNDLILLSPTGSGKTLAFLLPLVQRLNADSKNVQAIIIVPSRELAVQIMDVFRKMGTSFKGSCFYGGHSVKIEKESLQTLPAVLIGTPGRIAYHIDFGSFDTRSVHSLVLDEFDKALEYGFKKEMSAIISKLHNVKYRMLTSATSDIEIPDFVGLQNPKRLNYIPENFNQTDGLTLKLVNAVGKDKLEALFSLICKIGNKPTLVFCNHRDAVDRISKLLFDKQIIHDVFHGGLEQIDREKTLIKFKNGSNNFLISTDLSARGLDISTLENIIHYQLPVSENIFFHRNGRTARMNAKGTAYVILAENESQPDYFPKNIPIEFVAKDFELPMQTEWDTLYISAGKKDKISKADIVGFLIQKGELEKSELGLIEVLDHTAYAAVSKSKVVAMLQKIKGQKIKNQKLKFEVSR